MTLSSDIKDREFNKFRDAGFPETKVAVEVENDSSNPIPTYSTLGDPVNLFGEDVTDPGNEVTLISQTVTATKLRITKINTSCHIEGKASFLKNGNTVATSRTAPGRSDAEISFEPYIELVTGDTFAVKFKARPSSAVSEVESYISACEL